MFRDHTDDDLLQATRGGDDFAFAELCRRYRPGLFHHATALAGHHGADDLVAEALTATWQRLRAGGGPEVGFYGYVRTAVRNRYLSEQRSARPALSLDAEPEALETRVAGESTTTSAEVDVLREFDRTAVRDALATLPARWQHVLVRIYFDDAPWVQVADELGLAAPAARQLAVRARRGLLAALRDAGVVTPAAA